MLPPVRWLLGRLLKRKAVRLRQRFHAMTADPTIVQRNNLLTQIRREAPTAFGRDHGFGKVKSVADFRKAVPIGDYESVAPYIERVKQGETGALFHRQKVVMFAMTSGTTATRKFIPVTERALAEYRRGWTVWGLSFFEDHPQAWFKPMAQIVSDADEFRTPAGIPCGSMSGLATQMQRRVVRKTYVMPPESAKLKRIQDKYYLLWRTGVVRDLHFLVSANPSTMVNVGRFGTAHAETLIRDVRDGTVADDFAFPQPLRDRVAKYLAPHPERAAQLQRILDETGALRPKHVWPDLAMIGNWTGGSVGAYMRHYPDLYGTSPEPGVGPSVRDIGLVASEARMTIPVANDTPAGILEVSSSFFEFVPVDEIDSADPVVLEPHELEEGQDYYILLTTSGGLYRYNIHDVVRCVGWHQRTPLLAFLNKGAYFSNLTGEKLSEHQVVAAVQAALAELDLSVAAYTLAPCWNEDCPYYGLFLERSDIPDEAAGIRLAAAVERHLRTQNSEYVEKRDSRRLDPIRLQLMPQGTWAEWDRQRLLRNGGTAEQYKHPCLIPDPDFHRTMPVERELSTTV